MNGRRTLKKSWIRIEKENGRLDNDQVVGDWDVGSMTTLCQSDRIPDAVDEANVKKVLIITYDWPPAGGPGVQRNVKFTKYLWRFGWEPSILTVKGGEHHAMDDSLARDIPGSVRIVRTSVPEPHKLYKYFVGMGRTDTIPQAAITEKNVGWKKRMAFWINANVFVPDPRIGWYPFAVRAAKQLIRSEGIDLVMSSGPPHTTHLIARRLSRWCGIPWVADFRDPWTEVYYLIQSPRIACIRRWDERLEKTVLHEAHRVITVTRGMIEDDFKQKVPADHKYIQISNGYDEEDFQSFYTSEKTDQATCRIIHTGMVSDTQIPENLFKAIKRLAERNVITPEQFSLCFVGNVVGGLRRTSDSVGVSDFLQFAPYVPHREVLKTMGSASMLLLLIVNRKGNKHVHQAKLFEYLRTGKPILALGPPGGEAEEILRETKRGWVFDYSDAHGLERFLEGFLRKKHTNTYKTSTSIAVVGRFSRESLTERLAGVFDDLLAEQGGPG